MHKAHRFIGGEMHGKIIAVRDQSPYYRVRVREPFSMARMEDFTPASCVPIRDQTYQRERIRLGRNTFAEVMVLDTLTEDEKWRRIADLIEGCGANS